MLVLVLVPVLFVVVVGGWRCRHEGVELAVVVVRRRVAPQAEAVAGGTRAQLRREGGCGGGCVEGRPAEADDLGVGGNRQQRDGERGQPRNGRELRDVGGQPGGGACRRRRCRRTRDGADGSREWRGEGPVRWDRADREAGLEWRRADGEAGTQRRLLWGDGSWSRRQRREGVCLLEGDGQMLGVGSRALLSIVSMSFSPVWA